MYLRGSFVLDAALLATDCVILATTFTPHHDAFTTSHVRVLRVVKVTRLVRFSRVLQSASFRQTLDDWLDRKMPHGLRALVNILFIFMVALLLGHLLACAWFAIGSLPGDTGNSWLEAPVNFRGTSHRFGSLNTFFLYTSSLHWSIAQMTLGCNEIVSTTSAERLFSVLLLFIGLFLSSTLVSAFSATLIEYQMQRREQLDQMRLVRQFLSQNAIGLGLSLRIQGQIERQFRQKPILQERDVAALTFLSKPLQRKLRFEMYKGTLLCFPPFRIWMNLSVAVAKEVCAGCTDFLLFQPNDVIFSAGKASEKMYFIVNGKMKYIQDPNSSVERVRKETPVEMQWMCEAALWIKWTHVGDVETVQPSKLISITSDVLHSAVRQHRVIWDISLAYCTQFCKKMRSAKPPERWPSDIFVPWEFSDLVMAMGPSHQRIIGFDAMRQLHSSKHSVWPNASQSQQLEDELWRGKSVLLCGSAGEVERVVFLTVVKIVSDGLVLAQLGKLQGAKIVSECKLPGSKQELNEMPYVAAKRVMSDNLCQLSSFCEITGCTRSEHKSHSSNLDVSTRYIKTTVDVEVCGRIVIDAPTYHAHGRTATRSFRLSFLNGRSRFGVAPSGDIDEFAGRSVFCIPARGKTVFYSWLTPDEFERLSHHKNGPGLLERWMSALDFDGNTGESGSQVTVGVFL